MAALDSRGLPSQRREKAAAASVCAQDWSAPVPSDQGWNALEAIMKLAEWDKSRRLVALRRAAKSDVALTRNSDDGQMELLLPGEDVE